MFFPGKLDAKLGHEVMDSFSGNLDDPSSEVAGNQEHVAQEQGFERVLLKPCHYNRHSVKCNYEIATNLLRSSPALPAIEVENPTRPRILA
jgi:hypothetical protein